MESQTCVFLGIKVKEGPIQRFKLENFQLENTVECLKSEAEKKANVPSASLELIHHGKILKDTSTLQDCGVKSGETIHVVKKKVHVSPPPPPTYSDTELQQLNSSLRTLGCTPNAPGWTRAMQLLNDESAMSEIIEQAPSLGDDCVTLSILHEVELLAAMGANLSTMRRGANAHPDLPTALRHLTRLVRTRANAGSGNENVPTSGFVYSLEALSEDEDAEEEEGEDAERNPITQEQLSAALQAATEAMSSVSSRSGSSQTAGSSRSMITPEMFSEAISEAINRSSNAPTTSASPMEQSTAASSSQSPVNRDSGDFATQLNHMHEMGLLDDAINVRALLICAGDVNAAINLVFSGAIGDE